MEGLAGRPWFNLPSVLIMFLVTIILVRGIRESARTNAVLVLIKVSVVLFVIAVGIGYVQPGNWTSIPVEQRVLPEERVAADLVKKELAGQGELEPSPERVSALTTRTDGPVPARMGRRRRSDRLREAGRLSRGRGEVAAGRRRRSGTARICQRAAGRAAVEKLLPEIRKKRAAKELESWGLLGCWA